MLKKNWPINSPKIFQAQQIKALIMDLEVLHLALEATKGTKALEGIKVTKDLEEIKVTKDLEEIKVTKDLEEIKVTKDLEEIKVLEEIKGDTDKTSHHKNNK
jgi:hypothetical protein